MTTGGQTWQDAILAHFTPKRESMLLAIDPDSLLRDDALLAAIQNSNYDVLELGDEVAFRDGFERNYRSRWDAGEARHIVVVAHTTDAARHIPYDLWQKSRRVELSVANLFTHLNAIVVRDLDNAYYADLYPAHQQLVARHEMQRGERQTIEFILRAVFGLDPLAAGDPARWVEFLIHKHYSGRTLPPALEAYVAERLLPLAGPIGLRRAFLTDAAAFYAWLGSQWAAYVASFDSQPAPAGLAGVAATASRPPTLDFSDSRLRPLLGYLFAEGLVARAPLPAGLSPERAWMAYGLSLGGLQAETVVKQQALGAVYMLKARLGRFCKLEEAGLPAGPTDLRDWLNLAAEWAEVVHAVNTLPETLYVEIKADLAAARAALDRHFWAFLQARYSAADYYSDNRGPITVAAINGWLSRAVKPDARLALVCCDGMALDAWRLLADHLRSMLPGLTFDENRTFALAPTVTPVSRQALFAGRPPTAFGDTIGRTDQDPARWKAYWINHDVPKTRVTFQTFNASGPDLAALQAVLDSQNRRLGILLNLFDDVMHLTKETPAGADKRVYYDTVRSHLRNGHIEQLFDLLLSAGYRLFVTADHGGIAGQGIGLTPPRALIETYARRVVIFDRPALAQEYAATHGLRYFRTKALPPEMHPVYLPGTDLFAGQGAAQVSHGGLSLEELVVPFVEIRR